MKSVKQILNYLETQSNSTRIKVNQKNGNKLPQFGVPMLILRKLANELGKNQELASSLWNENNLDAKMLSVMIMDPKKLNKNKIELIANEIEFCYLMDDFIDYVVFMRDDRDIYMEQWIKSSNDILGRGGWYLVVKSILKNNVDEQKIDRYLNIIKVELGNTTIKKQEAMNRALCEIGINYPKYTGQCLKIGEELGVYRDIKVSKGCTSPYAIDWIRVGLEKKEKVKT